MSNSKCLFRNVSLKIFHSNVSPKRLTSNISIRVSHLKCLIPNVSLKLPHSKCITKSLTKCLIWSILIKMSLPKYFNQNVSLNDPKCLTQWFKMSHSMTQNVSCGSSVLLFVKTILTFPQLLVPKETIPTRYLVWSKLPRFCDIKGPPESPEQESFPIKGTIKCCSIKDEVAHLVLHPRRGVCLDECQRKEENEFDIVGCSK